MGLENGPLSLHGSCSRDISVFTLDMLNLDHEMYYVDICF